MFFEIVLPMNKTGKVNRQDYEHETFDAAKKSFHTNCGKYFNIDNLQQAAVIVTDDLGNTLLKDSWVAPKTEPQTPAES